MTPVAAPARRVAHRSHVSEEWRRVEVFIGIGPPSLWNRWTPPGKNSAFIVVEWDRGPELPDIERTDIALPHQLS